MKRAFIILIILIIYTTGYSQEWQHPSQTWDKKNIGTGLVVSGFLMTTVPILASMPKTPTTKSIVVLGAGVSISGVIYWICGETKWDRKNKLTPYEKITRY